MSILPGFEAALRRNELNDGFAGMINDLIEQANVNYLHYLAAAATHDTDEVWDRFHESFALEHDIETLATLYEIMCRTTGRVILSQ